MGREAHIVLLGSDAAEMAAWGDEIARAHVPATMCATVGAALDALDGPDVTAFVYAIDVWEDGALDAIRAARERIPPAQVVVLTSDPDAARTRLRARNLIAEILRGPATAQDLLLRLGLPEHPS